MDEVTTTVGGLTVWLTGLSRAMAGIDDPYEPPRRPDLTIDTEHVDLADAVTVVGALLSPMKESA